MLALIDAYVGNKPSLTANEIELVARDPMQVAAVRVHTSRANVAQDVTAGFTRLAHGLAAHALQTLGPPMLVYLDLIDEQNDGDLEVAVPIAAWKPAAGPADEQAGDHGLYSRVLPACTLATIVHRGPFADVAAAHHRLYGWIAERGVEITGPAREVYLTDPSTIAPANLLTRIEVPVEARP